MTQSIQKINGKTSLTGIIGFPVAHSLSPLIHNAAFSEIGCNYVYIPLLVQPGRLEDAVAGLVSLGFCGANITAPYKEEVIRTLDAIDPVASELEAVNTLVISRGVKEPQIKGYNTDVHGFIEGAKANGFDISNASRAVVVGAGGAARAVVYALLRGGSGKVHILNRSIQRANILVDALCQKAGERERVEVQVLNEDNLLHSAQQADLLINATPIGTWPKAQESIWKSNKPIPKHLTVYDLVYNPEMTLLLRQASEAGAATIGGIMMLIHQAALAFRLWTGEQAPVSLMASIAKEALKKLSDAADTSDKN